MTWTAHTPKIRGIEAGAPGRHLHDVIDLQLGGAQTVGAQTFRSPDLAAILVAFQYGRPDHLVEAPRAGDARGFGPRPVRPALAVFGTATGAVVDEVPALPGGTCLRGSRQFAYPSISFRRVPAPVTHGEMDIRNRDTLRAASDLVHSK